MKLTATLFIAFLLLTGCTKQSATVNPPTSTGTTTSPNANVIAALDTFGQVGCALGAASVTSQAAVTLLTGLCPDTVTGISDVILANGSVAKINSLITTLMVAAIAIPNLSANDRKYVTLALALAQAASDAYAQATGQSVTADLSDLILANFSDTSPRKLKFTPAEKENIKAIRARARYLKAHPRK